MKLATDPLIPPAAAGKDVLGILSEAHDKSYHVVAGAKAKAEGKPETANPYPEGSDPARLWLEGFKGTYRPPYGKDAKMTAAGVLFVTPDKRVLLLKRGAGAGDHQGEWGIPGGGLEAGEEPVDAARRESEEEVGKVPDLDPLPYDQRISPEGVDFHTFTHAVNKPFYPALNEEHDEHGWFPLNKLPEPLHPGVKATLTPATNDPLIKDGFGADAKILAGWGVKIGQNFKRLSEDTTVKVEQDLGGGKVKVRFNDGTAAIAEKRSIAQDAKLSHEEVHYGPAITEDCCSRCAHYFKLGDEEEAPGSHCELVEDPIEPEGWCERFAADPLAADDFKEDDHPRDESGKFGAGGGGAKKAEAGAEKAESSAEGGKSEKKPKSKAFQARAAKIKNRLKDPDTVKTIANATKSFAAEHVAGVINYSVVTPVVHHIVSEVLPLFSHSLGEGSSVGVVATAVAAYAVHQILEKTKLTPHTAVKLLVKVGKALIKGGGEAPAFHVGDAEPDTDFVESLKRFVAALEKLDPDNLPEGKLPAEEPEESEDAALDIQLFSREQLSAMGENALRQLARNRGMSTTVSKALSVPELIENLIRLQKAYYGRGPNLDFDCALGNDSILAMDRTLVSRLTEQQREALSPRVGLAFDKQSVRNYDQDGRLHVELTNISKAMVSPYIGYEIPQWQELGLNPDKVYKLLRDPEELARAAPSSNGIQVLRKHIPVDVNDHKPYDTIGATGTDAVFEAPYLKNSLVIWSKSDIDDIDSEVRKELSCAYRYRVDLTPGTYEGEKFDGVMRDLAFNHVAVIEEGRCGPTVAVADHFPGGLSWALIEQAVLSLGFPE